MLLHVDIIIRLLCIPFHHVTNVDAVREPFCMLLPWVIIIPKPALMNMCLKQSEREMSRITHQFVT